MSGNHAKQCFIAETVIVIWHSYFQVPHTRCERAQNVIMAKVLPGARHSQDRSQRKKREKQVNN